MTAFAVLCFCASLPQTDADVAWLRREPLTASSTLIVRIESPTASALGLDLERLRTVTELPLREAHVRLSTSEQWLAKWNKWLGKPPDDLVVSIDGLPLKNGDMIVRVSVSLVDQVLVPAVAWVSTAPLMLWDRHSTLYTNRSSVQEDVEKEVRDEEGAFLNDWLAAHESRTEFPYSGDWFPDLKGVRSVVIGQTIAKGWHIEPGTRLVGAAEKALGSVGLTFVKPKDIRPSNPPTVVMLSLDEKGLCEVTVYDAARLVRTGESVLHQIWHDGPFQAWDEADATWIFDRSLSRLAKDVEVSKK